jgi:hypothetical protein
VSQLMSVLTLKQNQTNSIIKRDTYPSGTYTAPMTIEGASMYCSVWVKSIDPGATLLVRYFETTSGNVGEERVVIGAHTLVTSGLIDPQYGFTNSISVDKFHNKPVCEAILTGGSAEFGVYLTVLGVKSTSGSGSSGSAIEDISFQLPYNAVTGTFPNQTTEIYKSYLGGLSGTLQETITVIYTDATKADLASAVRA